MPQPNREIPVVLLSQCFPPETHAGANRLGALADSLADRSSLTVVTPEPSYPHPDFHGLGAAVGHDAGVAYGVRRVAAFHPHRGSYLVRGGREAVMGGELAKIGAGVSPEVIVATSPSLFVGLAGAAVARRIGARFIWDVRDLTWSYLEEDPGRRMRSSAMRRAAAVLRSRSRAAMHRADRVVASNRGIAAAIVGMGIPAERVSVVRNGISQDLLMLSQQIAERPPSPSRQRVTYAGAIGYYQGLHVLLDAATQLPGVDFYLVGDGPLRHTLEGEAQSRRLENVVFTGYVDRTRLFELYEQSDILFAGLRDLPSMATVTFPSKPFEFMATGRPIVYAGRGITAEFLESAGCALIAEPEVGESVAAAVTRLLGDDGLWRRLAEAGRLEAPKHRREDLMREYADLVLGPDPTKMPPKDLPTGVPSGTSRPPFGDGSAADAAT